MKEENSGMDWSLLIVSNEPYTPHITSPTITLATDIVRLRQPLSILVDSLRLVKEQHKKVIGLITPGAPKRKTSRQLSKHADFIKEIRTWALEASLLPTPVPGSNIYKPASW